ncbi:MAG TPA: hypothetical protein EYM83_04205, partial [Nitrospirales bacterium]|nr:hypothetical protein [Nitrospirales bacterium]
DLQRSQLFRIEDIDGVADLQGKSPKPALIQRVSASGVHVSVWGKLERRGDDIFLDAFLYEGEAGRKVLRKVYTGSKGVVRAMVHRLSNMIIERYTGQRGVAGTQIAFVAEINNGKQLHVMGYDGYRPRPLTNNRSLNLFPHWSPGKRFLAFTSYLDGNPDIHVMDLTTGEIRNVVAFQGANITPAWSPDGKQLAFASSFDGDSDIYTIEASGGTKLRQLTFSPASDFSPTWSPSGIEIAFSSDRGGSLQIYVMDADGSNVRRLTFEGRYNTAPAWSPDGRWIAYTCRNKQGSLKICRVTPDGRQSVQVTQSVGDHESASWSPDGRHIVFSVASRGESDIYSVHYDGSGLVRLTSGPYRASSPSWSLWE